MLLNYLPYFTPYTSTGAVVMLGFASLPTLQSVLMFLLWREIWHHESSVSTGIGWGGV